VFNPQTRERANRKPRVLICDGFRTYKTLEILEFCLANNITLCRLPSHTSHKLQPCDVGPFAPLKTAYHDQVEQLNQGGVDKVSKEHFTYLYSPARDRALTKRNVRAGWAATGLFPFNLERVLRDIPKPAVKLTIPRVNSVTETYPREEALHTPVTLVTLITAEALTLLHKLIKQGSYTPNLISKQRLQQLVQKLASAA
jgi:hypothetical protein